MRTGHDAGLEPAPTPRLQRPWQVLVVVPARNEEADLGACLTSVDHAVARVRRARPACAVRVVVVLDSCTDRTAEVLDHFPHVARLDVRVGLVGAARAAGILAARTHDLDHPAERTWLACTDADGQVPVDWLTGQLDHADRGACAVVGTVEPHHDLPAPVRARWQALHATHEGHTHVHGANLGVRLDHYDAVGGFEALAEHEDVRLVERLVAAGALLVRTGGGRVTTSSRRVGRTPGGFAAYLGVLHDLHDLHDPHDPRDPVVTVTEVDDRAAG